MQPSNILSYYPTYSILDEIINYKNYNQMNLYIDLKNCLKGIYVENFVMNMLESTKACKFIDTSIFSSILTFLSFHKLYAIKRRIDLKTYIFFDFGVSYYHSKVKKNYKISRRIDELYGLDKENRNLFSNIVQKNLMLIESACNKFPNTHVIKLEHLESDFIPYYLIKNKLVNIDDSTCHILYSSDKDLFQTISLSDHIYQFRKIKKDKYIIKKNEVMNIFLKEKVNLPDYYFPMALAILGDSVDDIDGIKGIGNKTIVNVLKELFESGLIDKDNYLHDVSKNKKLFPESLKYYEDSVNNRGTYKVIEREIENQELSRNLKLISFEVICNLLDNPIETEMLDRRKSIVELFQNKTVADIEGMKKALEMNRIYLEGEELETIYYK